MLIFLMLNILQDISKFQERLIDKLATYPSDALHIYASKDVRKHKTIKLQQLQTNHNTITAITKVPHTGTDFDEERKVADFSQ